ncbi:MAG: hypothetical protein JSV64_02750, partial [Candidatus Bathyarchaeota archaeon]
MLRRIAFGIMRTLLLIGILTLAFNIQQTESSEPPILEVSESPPTEWNKTYGGMTDEVAYSVVQTLDGGYAMAGMTDSFGEGGGDCWLVKTDASGNHVWNQTYGGTSWDWGRSVVQTLDGGYAMAGMTDSFGEGGGDCWLVKT